MFQSNMTRGGNRYRAILRDAVSLPEPRGDNSFLASTAHECASTLGRRAAVNLIMVVAATLVCCLLAGCDSLTGPGIVGKWQSDANSSNTMEFFSDGTCQEVAILGTRKGTYKIIQSGRMKTEIEGLLWGTNEGTWTYMVSGDKLTLTTEGAIGITLNFTKVK